MCHCLPIPDACPHSTTDTIANPGTDPVPDPGTHATTNTRTNSSSDPLANARTNSSSDPLTDARTNSSTDPLADPCPYSSTDPRTDSPHDQHHQHRLLHSRFFYVYYVVWYDASQLLRL